ncbi:unnamed protein product [Ilex paraguariensis]|uniref:Transposase n=1 Tax=Ilex paraguariensis TaxID=185542 RepID=A0ABC8S591_9AQUA
MLKNIGVGYNQITIFYQRIGNGWRALENDQHAMDLIKWVDKVKVIDVYMEHIRQELFNHSQADSNCGPSEKRFGSQNIHVFEQETNLWGPRVPTESYRSSESDVFDSDSYSKGSDSKFEDMYDSVYDEYLHETIVESDKGERFDKPKRKGVQIEIETTQEHECGVGGEDCESDELRSLSGSLSDNDETRHQRKKYSQFNAKSDMVDPHFKLGMLFKNSVEFRAAVRQHAIKWGKKYGFLRMRGIESEQYVGQGVIG